MTSRRRVARSPCAHRGLDAYWVRDWARAVETLKRVYAIDRLSDARVMLGQAFFIHGVVFAGGASLGRVQELPGEIARAASRAPRGAGAPREGGCHHAYGASRTFHQLVVVYENHEPVNVHRLHRPPAQPTLPGRYEIEQDTLGLRQQVGYLMPYWLGIYWAGGSGTAFTLFARHARWGPTSWRDRLAVPAPMAASF